MNSEASKIISEYAQNGVLTSRFLDEHGIHRSVLQELVASGEYYQVKRGIYVRHDEFEDEFYITQLKYPRGIFSHATALYLYNYSDRVPISLHMTFPKGYNCPSLKKENITVTRVSSENYNLGITEVKTGYGDNTVRAYDLERSLCDVLRGKGDDIQIVQAAMKQYAYSRWKDLYKLMEYAKQLKVESKVRRYMEVLL